MKPERNPGCELDLGWLNSVHVNLGAINKNVEELLASRDVTGDNRAAWLLRAITCIDLTTLAGDDTYGNVARLCRKAMNPIPEDLLNELGFQYNSDCPIRTAAVCVYPSKVNCAYSALSGLGCSEKIHVASVATGFPAGQTPLTTRLEEIKYAVAEGASEIDIVINRSLVITGQWQSLYQEIQQMKEACGPTAHMKTILATGELGTYDNVYKAALVAMMAGSDFIKTSTGKESVNATLQFGLVMARAIREYSHRMGYKVGLKPAGGIRTSKDAISWFILIKEVLGDDYLCPELFRFGASGLLTDIECNLYKHVTGFSPLSYEFSMG